MPSDAADRSPGARRGLLVTAIVLLVVLVDQATKAWAVEHLADGPVHLVGDDVELRLSRNPGGAFSIFQGYTPLLALLAVVLTVVLVRVVTRTRDALMLVALALVLAGALGNLVDRLVRAPGFLRGEVVDFIGVGSFPTFNVADAAITIGAGLLLVAVLRAPDGAPATDDGGTDDEVRGGR